MEGRGRGGRGRRGGGGGAGAGVGAAVGFGVAVLEHAPTAAAAAIGARRGGDVSEPPPVSGLDGRSHLDGGRQPGPDPPVGCGPARQWPAVSDLGPDARARSFDEVARAFGRDEGAANSTGSPSGRKAGPSSWMDGLRVRRPSSSASLALSTTAASVSWRPRRQACRSASAKELVQRSRARGRVQQAGERVLREDYLLEQERHVVRPADPLEEVDRARRPGSRARRRTPYEAPSTRPSRPPRTARSPGARLLGEANLAGDVAVDGGRGDERAPAARALEPALARQIVEGPTNRDQAAAVPFGQLPLRRELFARLPFGRIERASSDPDRPDGGVERGPAQERKRAILSLDPLAGGC